ncbi:hypothetical protein [Duganella sp. CF517]|uniref:hypothetical protein n=1 Tax=Duganella sp. CF517 TaxID=1881038 RepID=UPI001160C93C|nr:hypothetical protein [Duganella sp. CF517]
MPYPNFVWTAHQITLQASSEAGYRRLHHFLGGAILQQQTDDCTAGKTALPLPTTGHGLRWDAERQGGATGRADTPFDDAALAGPRR